MSTIRFEIRKDQKNKEGNAPIRLIYQLQGQRKYISAGVKIKPENWDDVSQQIKYNRSKGELQLIEVKKLNGKLADLKRKIETIENRQEVNGIIYNTDMIIRELTKDKAPAIKHNTSSKELYAFIDRYIEDHKLVRVKGSLSVYKALKLHLQGYEQLT